jgi:uncharacterized protein (TIGR02246 family)
MSTAGEEILALCRTLREAHASKDADAIARCYANEAVIYDMAPPLGRRGIDRDRVAAWLDSWATPVLIDAAGIELTIGDDMAFYTARNRMRGTKTDGTAADLWFRRTMVLRRRDGGWRIMHDHTSVPFYMDGSFRAAVDLPPDLIEDQRTAAA